MHKKLNKKQTNIFLKTPEFIRFLLQRINHDKNNYYLTLKNYLNY